MDNSFDELTYQEQEELMAEAQKHMHLHWSVSWADGYVHATVRPTYVHPRDGRPHFYTYGHDYESFGVFAQGNSGEDQTYGWECAYQFYRTDLKAAKTASRVLGRIERALEKMNEVEGRPKTFGQYVNRVARILKAEGGVSHLESPWYWTLGDIPEALDGEIAKALKGEQR